MLLRARLIPIVTSKDGTKDTSFVVDVQEDMVIKCMQEFIDFVQKMDEEFGGINDFKELNKFLDYLVLSARASLYINPEDKVLKAVPKAIHTFLKDRNQNLEDVQEYIRKLYDEHHIGPDLPHCLLEIPGDPRPGLNSISYFVFSQTLSAIACSKYLNGKRRGEEEVEEKLAKLRLLCLIYPFYSLTDKAEEIIRNKNVNSFVLKTFVELIQDNRIKDPELSDLFYSSIRILGGDELLPECLYYFGDEQIKNLLREKIKRYDNQSFDRLFYSPAFVKEFDSESLRRMTISFVKGMLRLDKDSPIFQKRENKEYKEIIVVRFDVRSVQKQIRVDDLRTMVFGSFIVDYCVFVVIPLSLVMLGLPAECVVYYGGGNTTVLIPATLDGDGYKKLVEEAKRRAEKLGLSIQYGHSSLLNSFMSVNKTIDVDITLKKLSDYDTQPLWKGLNLFYQCQFCHRRPASEQITRGEETKYVCRICKDRYEACNELYFVKRLELMWFNQEERKEILQEAIGFIAGEDIGASSNLSRNIAVLRVDANNLGRYMSSSINIADAFERSITIDRSIKQAYRDFIELLRKASKGNGNQYRSDLGRVLLGTMYIGGDDATIFLPSRIALHMAVYMVSRFFELMGGTLTLSAGIVVAKPQHPFLQLYESAGYLLDEISKRRTRNQSFQSATGNSVFRGAISFYVADSGYVDSLVLEQYLKTVYEKRISLQYFKPYRLLEQKDKTNILTLLNLISSFLGNGEYSIDTLECSILQDITAIFKGADNYVDHLKSNIIRPLKSVISATAASDRSNQVKVLYALRQSARDNKVTQVYKMIAESALSSETEPGRFDLILPLDDILQAVKIVIGE